MVLLILYRRLNTIPTIKLRYMADYNGDYKFDIKEEFVYDIGHIIGYTNDLGNDGIIDEEYTLDIIRDGYSNIVEIKYDIHSNGIYESTDIYTNTYDISGMLVETVIGFNGDFIHDYKYTYEEQCSSDHHIRALTQTQLKTQHTFMKHIVFHIRKKQGNNFD